ncbi:MAG: RNA polymerase sigma factor [Planctomycetota bacterium]
MPRTGDNRPEGERARENRDAGAMPARVNGQAAPGPSGPPEAPRPDPAVLKRAKAGDRDALAALLEPETARIHAICVRMVGPAEARDLAQDALVKVIRGLPSFDGRSQLSTWITRVAMNACLSWLRAEGRARTSGKRPVSLDSEPAAEPHDPGGVQSRAGGGADTRPRLVVAALGQLSPEHRAILVLRDVRDLDYEQIAGVLDLASGTVKSRLFRARAALRKEVERLEGEARAEATEASAKRKASTERPGEGQEPTT